MTKAANRFPVLYGERVNNVAGEGSTKKGIARHLQPGVVTYDNEDGTTTTYLLELEGIEAMRPSAAGIPVVGKSGGFDHVKVEPGKEYDGLVTDSFWDGESGWETFKFDKMNADTAKACEKGFQSSCAYVPTETDGKPGLWHNVPYDEKILNGRYTHVAVVPNPRYNGATIELFNSKGGGLVNKTLKAILAALMPVKALKELVNSIEEDEQKASDLKAKKEKAKLDYDNAMKNAKTDAEKDAAKSAYDKLNAEFDGADQGISPEEKAKREKVAALRNEADTLEKSLGTEGRALNAGDAPNTDLPPEKLGGGDVVAEPGVPGHETPEQKAAALEKKNAEDAAAAAKAKAEGESLAFEKAEQERLAAEKKNADDKAAKDKAETERKNTLELKAKAAAEAKQEALRAERFNALRRAADERGGVSGSAFVGVVTMDEKEDLGRERYGSRK